MEELRSTEILDREIQEDARRKADKLLRDADKQCEKILPETESRLAKAIEEKKAFYARELSIFEHDTNAMLPLVQQRYLVSFIDSSVSSAIQAYFDKLDEQKKIALLAELLKKQRASFAEGLKFNVYTSNLDAKKLQEIVKDVFGKSSVLSCSELSDAQKSEIYENSHEIFEAKGKLEGMILETEDKSIKCNVTLSIIIEELMNKYSEELATTLFCGRLPE